MTDGVTGTGLPGVCVYLYTAAGAYAGTGACTGAGGAYSITGVSAGQYTVAAYDPNGTHPTTWYGNVTTQAAASTFSVASGAVTSPIDVSASELVGITGTVRDSSSGGRVAGACIYATQTSGGSATYATCLASGSSTYAITGIAPGGYDLAFYDPAGLHATVHATATVVANKTTGGVDGNMPEVTAVVGSLIDAGTSGPVANGCVMLYAPGGGYVPGSYRCTDANGNFVIDGIAPGRYLLAYYDPAARFATLWFDGKPDQSSASVVTITANTITTLGAERITTSGSATGLVRNADGTPAVNVCAYADNLSGAYTGVGGCSDTNGRYTLAGLPAGQYKIAFYPPGSTGTSTYWYSQRNTELSATAITITGLTTTTLTDETLGGATSTAPGPVTTVTATSANSVVHLRWVNPPDADFAGVTIRRAAGSVAPTSPTDGTAVAEVTAPGTSFDDANVTAGATYTYALFAHDQSANYAPAATTTVTASAAVTAQHECGTIGANASWSPAQAPVYVLDCAVTIAPNTTLTLAPGTIVKSAAGANLVIQGSLISSGTTARPITFTSLRDDSIGGDTNGDGGATSPARGDWAGITTSPVTGSAAPSILINATTIAYATTGLSLSGSATSVTNSAVSHTTSDGIDVTSPVGVPRVTGNTVTNAGGVAVSVTSASVDMGALNGNSGSSDGLNGVQFTADTVSVSSSLPWTGTLLPVLYGGCSALTVPAGVTLTLGAGTIIKAQSNNCAYLNVQGSLVASGTAASPVTLTSWRDDSIGGDTNGDGSATAPQRGDWGGIVSTPPGAGNANPSVTLDHVNVQYATTGLSLSQSATSVTNSVVGHTTSDGIDVTSPVGVPRVTGNTVTNAGGVAVSVTSASVDMGALNGNSGSSDGLNGVQFTADTVSVSSSLPWTGTLLPVLYGGCSALTVPAGVTLTLGAGTIIKAQSNNCAYLNVQGSLVASGTAASPVTLTSWRDDSIGGDTNGDGAATKPAAGDWGGVVTSLAGGGNANPSVTLDHLNLQYASTGLSLSQTATSVTNSLIGHISNDGIDVNSPVGVPTVTGNTVTNAGGIAVSVTSASVDMGALNGNSGSSDGLNGVQFTADTVSMSSSLPWTGTLLPVLYGGCSALTVPAGVTLTLGAGTIIKAQSNNCAYLNVQGSLVASGTAASPVTLTSWRDDSIGGDTNGDGSATAPQRGDWGGIVATPPGAGNANPSVTLDHVNVQYAATGLSLSQSATSVTNSVVGHTTSDGIDVTSPVGVPRVTGNTVTNAGGVAVSVTSASVDMGALNGNSGSSDGLNGVQFTADTVSVSSSLPWTGTLLPVLYGGCSALTVPAGVTLTLGAGTIIKAQSNNCAYLNVQGSLVASGTAASPVTLTSWRDDSIGGDTNGDGSATAPQRGDWGGIVSTPPGAGNANPSVTLDHVNVQYATTGLSLSQSATSVTNSVVGHTTSDGIDVTSPVGVPRVTGNTVTNAGGVAVSVTSASVDMGALNGNSGSSDGLNGVQFTADTVSVSSSLPWTGTLLPVLYGGCSALTVPAGVTLTLGAGTIIKAQSNNCAYLNVQGSLVASGTAASPVTLTSWRDDSIGGDTNGDGAATKPAAGDWGGVVTSLAGGGNANPSVTLDHLNLQYASTGLSLSQTATSVTNSLIGHISNDGIDVNSPVGVPTVTGNTVTNAGGIAVSVTSASVDMGALNGNSGSGDGLNGVQFTADTVSVSSSLPWTGTLLPVLYGGCSALTVPAGVTLTLGAGTIIKAQSNNCAYLNVQGSLVASGTAASPVTLTSWRDDSIGGDTNGDGSATKPGAGDWGGIVTTPPGAGNANPTVRLDHVNLQYASTGLTLSQTTTSVTNSVVGHTTNDGIDVNSPIGVPTVTGTTVTNGGGIAISVSNAFVDMAALNGNSGSSNGLNGVQFSGDTLSVSSTLPWSGTLLPILYGGCNAALSVPAGFTLTLGPGTIIKGTQCGTLVIQGTLIGSGTAANPAVLTSLKDDTVGGDTNGDGSSTTPAPGDWGGVLASPAGSGNPPPTIQLNNTLIRYATNGTNA